MALLAAAVVVGRLRRVRVQKVEWSREVRFGMAGVQIRRERAGR
jgi:hypothetical protein